MSAERIYPCERCGLMRSKAEGGTIFTVCDTCWDAAMRCWDATMRSSSPTITRDLSAAHASELAHLQKALNERELELLRVKGERDALERCMMFIDGMALTAVQTACTAEIRNRMLWQIKAACRGELPDWYTNGCVADTALAATEGKDKP